MSKISKGKKVSSEKRKLTPDSLTSKQKGVQLTEEELKGASGGEGSVPNVSEITVVVTKDL